MATPPSQLSFVQDERPDGMTYLENYISKDEADRFIQEVDAAPWCTDLKRRVQHYGYHYDYKLCPNIKAQLVKNRDHSGAIFSNTPPDDAIFTFVDSRISIPIKGRITWQI